MNKNKIDWVNISKGIAILLVIFEHALFKVDLIGNTILMFHMPFFFFISGYCYHKKDDSNMKKWRINTLIKNIKIYVIFSIFGFIWYMVKSKFNIPFDNLILNFFNIFYANQAKYHLVAGGMWFVISLLFTKLLFSFLVKFIDKLTAIENVLILIVFGSIAIFLNSIGINMLPFCLDNVRFSILFYYLGYLYQKYFNDKEGNVIKVILFGVILFLTTYFNPVSIMMHENSYGNYILFFFGSIFGILCLINISKLITNNKNFNKIFTFFGKNTLYYFTMQFICLDIVKKIFSYFEINNIMNSILVFIIVVMILIPINKFLDKKLTPFIMKNDKKLVN